MKLLINIDCSGAAFERDPVGEVLRIVKDARGRLELAFRNVHEPALKFLVLPLFDINGNTVGRAEVRK